MAALERSPEEPETMTIAQKIIGTDLLRTGDVVLSAGTGDLAERVAAATGSPYTHAAICYSNTEVADVTTSGIRRVGVDEYVKTFPYHAVFRLIGGWSSGRSSLLQTFVDRVIANKGKYDWRGALSLDKSRKEHEETLDDRLYSYLAGDVVEESTVQQSYFCSEFVASCFTISGIIEPSAAIVYQPDTFAAIHLARARVFGWFTGYIAPTGATAIPIDDEFAHWTSYTDLISSLYVSH